MKNVLVTGSNGFVGRNLCLALAQLKDVQLFRYDVDSTPEELDQALAVVDVIFHLAGVNRPSNIDEFKTGNVDFTESLCAALLSLGRTPLIILSSSIQAALDNPYGISKRQAEMAVEDYACKSATLRHPPSLQSPFDIGSSELNVGRSPSLSHFSAIYRLPNVFGKWCRPNYNSAVATWCYNIANGLPIQVRDPDATVTLAYVDDVVDAFINELGDIKKTENEGGYRAIPVTYTKTLGEITTLIESFRSSRTTLQIPSQADGFAKKLYATYLSYLPTDQFSYPLKMNVDARGSFTEILKTPERGQVSVNISKPGIVKGNHWHHTKVEKFLVVRGKGVIRFRRLGVADGIRTSTFAKASAYANTATADKTADRSNVEQSTSNIEKDGAERHPSPLEVESSMLDVRSSVAANNGILEYHVSGDKLEVVDIPPGYTHNIENLGDSDMVTVMWASEALDPGKPDTFFEKV